ncbi:hypothetical protein EV363DRAFT_1300017 [Boletus edulis]|nr:hypothetical protein EV363DRAFT_1300017 [Boletus edulis]
MLRLLLSTLLPSTLIQTRLDLYALASEKFIHQIKALLGIGVYLPTELVNYSNPHLHPQRDGKMNEARNGPTTSHKEITSEIDDYPETLSYASLGDVISLCSLPPVNAARSRRDNCDSLESTSHIVIRICTGVQSRPNVRWSFCLPTRSSNPGYHLVFALGNGNACLLRTDHRKPIGVNEPRNGRKGLLA